MIFFSYYISVGLYWSGDTVDFLILSYICNIADLLFQKCIFWGFHIGKEITIKTVLTFYFQLYIISFAYILLFI